MNDQVDYIRASWTPDREALLVDLLAEHNTPQYRRQNHWTKEAWWRISQAVNRGIPNGKLNLSQVKHHEQFLRKRFALIKRISCFPGMRWDNDRNMLCGQPSDWEKCISEVKGSHIWRDRVFPHYDKLNIIYKDYLDDDKMIDSTTSGNPKGSEANEDDISSSRDTSCSPPIGNGFFAPEPIQAKPPSHCEQIHKNEETPSASDVIFQGDVKKGNMLGANRQFQGEETHEYEEIPSTADAIFPRRKRRKVVGDSLENCLKGFLELRREEMELKKQQRQASLLETSDGTEKFSIANCIATANGLGKFTDPEIVKVSKFFLDAAVRELFLSLTESQKELWIIEQLQL